MFKSLFLKSPARIIIALPALLLLTACGSGGDKTSKTSVPVPAEPTPFSLNFKAIAGDFEVDCDNAIDGLGPNGDYSVGVADLRFFISNLQLFDAEGKKIAIALDANAFQLNHPKGAVALIDFTGNDSGFCKAGQEGTARTNTKITGTLNAATNNNAINKVTFDVGVAQPVMQAVIAATDVMTDAPSPLGELQWSWASGYRHFVVNFVAMDATHNDITVNSGFHIGSTNCASTANPSKALTDKAECGRLNTPKVELNNFNPATQTVTVDLKAVFANVQDSDFLKATWTAIENGDVSNCIDARRKNDNTSCVTDQQLGLQCHSGSMQAACASLFPNFGLTLENGSADASKNTVFGMK
ncbi:MAG: metallo-mystery pair system four-Cys motif protein [Marinagarivorans sp.]|nr:metallo-mystery pair system four-Cys motif protein [Marinagarivorans sp.]